MPNSLRARLKNLVHKGVLTQKDLDRIVIVPVDGTGDMISRQAVLDMIDNAQIITDGEFRGYCTEDIDINILPPVSTEKVGCWVEIDDEPHEVWECDHCGFVIDGSGCVDPYEYRDIYKYCPNCGAKMETQEETETCKDCTNKCIMYEPNMNGCKDKMEGVEE